MEVLSDENVCEFVTIESTIDDDKNKLTENARNFISEVGCSDTLMNNSKYEQYSEGTDDVQNEKQCLVSCYNNFHDNSMKCEKSSNGDGDNDWETNVLKIKPRGSDLQEKFSFQGYCSPVCYYDSDSSCREETVKTSEISTFTDLEEISQRAIEHLSVPSTPGAYNALSSIEIGESVPFSPQITAFNFESDSNSNEDSIGSIPATPRGLSNSIVNESENMFAPLPIPERDFCNEDTKIVLDEIFSKLAKSCSSKTNEISKVNRNQAGTHNSTSYDNLPVYKINEDNASKVIMDKSAWDSPPDAASSSIRSSVVSDSVGSPRRSSHMQDLKSENINTESLAAGNINDETQSVKSICDLPLSEVSGSMEINESSRLLFREDSPSPLFARKRAKLDLIENTDGEDIKNSGVEEEIYKTTEAPSEYAHQTYISDAEDEPPTPREFTKYSRSYLSDFEIMLKKKRDEKRKSRKRGSNFITANDDLIVQLIDRMEEAAYEDRQLNKKGLPATKKVSMLKYIVSQLRKKDLQSIFLEHNILGTLTEWLSPLPNKSLPCQQIREHILRLLDDFPHINASLLRHSGISRMVKFLQEHPEETKDNKERCHQLILKWTHPIHDSAGDCRALTKKERRERDYELSMKYAKQKSQTPSNCKKTTPNILDINFTSIKTAEGARPGEPGWIPRARVPQLPMRDYIRRPVSKLQCEISTKAKQNRFEIFFKKIKKAERENIYQRTGNRK